jgi:hypothetical protein
LPVGELEIALRIVQQQEGLCLEPDNRDGLQTSYGNQAVILKAWGRLEEAMALLKMSYTAAKGKLNPAILRRDSDLLDQPVFQGEYPGWSF